MPKESFIEIWNHKIYYSATIAERCALNLIRLLSKSVNISSNRFLQTNWSSDNKWLMHISSWFWICALSTRRCYGRNSLWLSYVHGSRSHYVAAVRRKGWPLVFRNYSFSMSHWKSSISGAHTSSFENVLRKECQFRAKVSRRNYFVQSAGKNWRISC